MNFITVTQFNTYIRQIFEAEEMLSNISILGEVSGVSIVRGVAYFNVKDQGAILPCVSFNLGGFILKDGEQVIVTGSPNYYVKGGRLNFNVNRIVSYGVGVLYQKFLELKDKLEKEGLFDVSKKLPLPEIINRIGVITSPTGAVVHDIITVANRRNSGVDIVIYPIKVQGVGAEKEIADAMGVMQNANVDVIIIARGGGGIEDLQPFNTELLARAIYSSKIPTVSAIGHETDYTIADFVASVRVATPSAAAEVCTPDNALENKIFNTLVSKIKNFVVAKLNSCYNDFNSELRMLKQSMSHATCEYKMNIDSLYINSKKSIEQKLQHDLNDINLKVNSLNALNPINLLKAGYAKLYGLAGAITDISKVSLGENIDICLIDGSLKTNVIEIKRKV
ncbi:MAG: exodeoxyribonuclease VII large subunit [Clostridia bacterium]|jgi:exodeoxyribonuclease VII large subunit|nr:exodeoxyribonuclease VII large subunit [Clostridia bacterium]